MRPNYRAIVQYHFKKGLEEKGIRFLESELITKASAMGCHYIELWQNENDPSMVDGIAIWNSKEEAKTFQSLWGKKEKEFISLYCTEAPKRAFFKLRQLYTEKAKKAA